MPGRPPKPANELRDKRIQCVLNKDEYKVIERAAKSQGVSASSFLRDLALKAARRVLKKG